MSSTPVWSRSSAAPSSTTCGGPSTRPSGSRVSLRLCVGRTTARSPASPITTSAIPTTPTARRAVHRQSSPGASPASRDRPSAAARTPSSTCAPATPSPLAHGRPPSARTPRRTSGSPAPVPSKATSSADHIHDPEAAKRGSATPSGQASAATPTGALCPCSQGRGSATPSRHRHRRAPRR
jgi:hypothetical protein